MVRLLSLNVGLPRAVEWRGRIVNTAIWKSPVRGPVTARKLNIDGDGQADRTGHGGENRAVFVYQIDSYRYWESYLGRSAFEYGYFGENFTVEGLSDDEVCIGDRYRVGEALFEVSQPRVTCYRLGIRTGVPEMAALVVAHGRPGFYLRVIEEGVVQSDDEITQTLSGDGGMTISEINSLLYKPGHPRDRLAVAARLQTLSEGWRASFEALLKETENVDSGGNAGLTSASRLPVAWKGFREFRVSKKSLETDYVTSLELVPTDGEPLPEYAAGQFVVLRLDPRSNPTMLRSYSLSGRQDGSHYRVSIKRESHGAASRFVRDRLQAGDIVSASAPRGSFTLSNGDGPVVLISVGIGITPLLSILHQMAKVNSARPVWWVHGARNGAERVFSQETRESLELLPNARRMIFYSAPTNADVPGSDFDVAGRITAGALGAMGIPREADFFVCGPSEFQRDIEAGMRALGVEAGRIHSETFGSAPPITPGIAEVRNRTPHRPEGLTGSGPMVSFARSGIDAAWDVRFGSLLDFAEACDVSVRWACRTGVCHTCETAMVSGQVGYGPDPIDNPADGNILLCCSRPTTDVVIDL
ncbi:MOSC and FAD-binding oxidoreductase domain-containing protein [Rhizobium mesoamericanum]|uniref:MOSC domain containing protein n=1 Tax=Rhizobium mesoamericanum STM3625 TaxID=1211777 RepID=K0PQ95_9HYPH|nr:MOSC and FAD-binding oxidoreductase domain-containing protein [Rhizobium mesoamericanum]CCM76008.1 MOSC domain containing protein [Rhizobium mesoamericanum STM3625]